MDLVGDSPLRSDSSQNVDIWKKEAPKILMNLRKEKSPKIKSLLVVLSHSSVANYGHPMSEITAVLRLSPPLGDSFSKAEHCSVHWGIRSGHAGNNISTCGRITSGK